MKRLQYVYHVNVTNINRQMMTNNRLKKNQWHVTSEWPPTL